MDFVVIGAGTSGLLAAAMLRDECLQVMERQPALPNNHTALLRFKSSIVGDTLGIPFSRVRIMKAVVPWAGNAVGDALSYSIKTSGTATLRSVITAEGQIEERYIAPTDMISQMVRKLSCELKFGVDWSPALVQEGVRTISTLPMHVLMKMVGWEAKSTFRHVHGFNIRADLINCDVCASLYFPNPTFKPYRASITRNKLIVEYAQAQPVDAVADVMKCLAHFGLTEDNLQLDTLHVSEQAYAKILPIDEQERKKFIVYASENHGIYSLGRYATWRPGLLMDDLVHDVRVISDIARDGPYDHIKPKGRKHS